jgi:hypothetical protein
MTNIVPIDKRQYKQSLYTDMIALFYKHKRNLSDTELLEFVIRYTFTLLKLDTTIKTEYNEAYCDLFLKYAKENVNPEGFWGEYLIDAGCKKQWMLESHKFKQTMSIIPNLTANLINKGFKSITDIAGDSGDMKILSQLLLKVMDVQYRGDKDSGVIKERGRELAGAKERSPTEIDEAAAQEAEEYLKRQE